MRTETKEKIRWFFIRVLIRCFSSRRSVFCAYFLLYYGIILILGKRAYISDLISAAVTAAIFSFLIFKKRLSQVNCLLRIGNEVVMGLRDPDRYKDLDYEKDKEIIADDFYREFARGITESGEKKLTMTTHKAMLQNVVNSDTVQSVYETQIIPQKKKKTLALEVMMLSRGKTVNIHEREMFKVVFNKRNI